jgi:hypothetical protein
MSAALTQPIGWGRRRFLGAVLLIFILQLGLIFWLSERAPASVRPPASAPPLRLAAGQADEILALEDPTLFALPHQHGFSGPAWMSIPPPPVRSFSWTEPPRWLAFNSEDLGIDFNCFVATNHFDRLQTVAAPEPVPQLRETTPLTVPTESALRIEGDLARRPLLRPLTLRSWAGSDLLTNSVIQLLVDAEGKPVSATLLRPGSGSQAADAYALQQATAARFAPLAVDTPEKLHPPDQHVTWGKLIFQWQTVAEPTENSSPAAHP